jgi:hypothetical protein
MTGHLAGTDARPIAAEQATAAHDTEEYDHGNR